MIPIYAVNANTTYGLDGSSQNNYGMGSQFVTTEVAARRQAGSGSSGWLWLIAAVVLWEVLG